jgi:hypothetical protein
MRLARRVSTIGNAAVLILTCFAAIALVTVARAMAKPDFSGTWIMDKNRSFNNPPGLEQTMVVKQEGDKINLDATLLLAQGERKITETWMLNGVEEAFTPQAGAPPDSKGKKKAYWLPGDRGIILNEEVIAAAGTQVSQTMRKWTLSPDGTTLTVDYFIDSARGSYEAKRVFTKKP